MATNDDQFFKDHNENNWDPRIEHLVSSMPRYHEFMNDEMSQWLLDTAYFERDMPRADRMVARMWVEEYWIQHWGYIFHDQFDWAAWREINTP